MKIPDKRQNTFANLPCGAMFHAENVEKFTYMKITETELRGGILVNAVNIADGHFGYFSSNHVIAPIDGKVPQKVEFDKLHSGDTFYCDETIYIKISNPDSSYYEAVDLQTGKIYRFALDSRVYPANVHIENDR